VNVFQFYSGYPMKFIFICPDTGRPFDNDHFRIIEDRGISQDLNGNRKWDARVELLSPCPFCGKMHIFDVNELPCPFGEQND